MTLTVNTRIEWTPALRRELRAYLGITGEMMAARMGVDVVTVRRWEMDVPSPRNMRGPKLSNRAKYDAIAYQHKWVPKAYLCPDPSAHKEAA